MAYRSRHGFRYTSGYTGPDYREPAWAGPARAKRMTSDYLAWLQEERGMSREDATRHVDVMRSLPVASGDPVGLLSWDHGARESRARVEDWISNRVCIRTVQCWSATGKEEYGLFPVRCWSATAKEEYGLFPLAFGEPVDAPRWARFGAGWGSLPKGSAPTTYSLIVDGRCVDSFLSKNRAKARAKEIAA